MLKKVLIAAGILAASHAFAADKVTLQLSANDIVGVMNGLAGLDGQQKIAKNARGEDQWGQVSYDIAPAVRTTIAHDERVLRDAYVDWQSGQKSLPADQQSADSKSPVDLLSFTDSDIGVSRNQYPPSILSALSPLCPACAGMDATPK